MSAWFRAVAVFSWELLLYEPYQVRLAPGYPLVGAAPTNSVLWVAENTLGVHCSFCTIWRVMALAPLVCMAMKCKFTLNK